MALAEEILENIRHAQDLDDIPKVMVFDGEIPVTSTGKYQRAKLKPLFRTYCETHFHKGQDKR